MNDVQIEWPWQYNFPPFFTYQPHAETRSKQIAAWKSLVIEYCKAYKVCTLDTREATEMPLFNNASINRTIDTNILNAVLTALQDSGNAAALDKTKQRWEIYWHTLEEWGVIFYNYISVSNNLNTVLTLYELCEGEDVIEEEFYKLNMEVTIKVLKHLEKNGKCEMIEMDDQHGVKFF